MTRDTRRELAVVVGLWAALGVKLFLDNFLVTHDAAQYLEVFHYFYSQLIVAGDAPRWLAYGLNSRPAGINQIAGLSAAQYPVAFAGWLLGVRNVNTLFIASALLEQLLLAIGLLHLGRRLYASSLARVYVGIAGVATAFFWTQTAWNQRLYYLWPLVLVFLLRFFDTRRTPALWASFLLLVLSFLGVPMYVASLHVLVFLLFTIALPAWDRRWRRAPEWASLGSRPSIVLFGALLLTSASFLAVSLEGLSFTLASIPGRVSGSSAVTIDTFLRYGGVSTQQYLEWLYAVPYEVDLNVTTYVGLVTLALVFFGLFRVRTPIYRALWTVTLVLVALSLSNLTFVAPLVYHFPPMAIFRHLGYVAVLVKLFAIVLAGYGLDAALADRAAAFRRLRQPVPGLVHVALGLVLFVVALDVFVFQGAPAYYRRATDLSAIPFASFHLVALAILVGLVVYLHMGRRHSETRRGAAIVAAAAIELVSYQTCLFYSLPVRNDPALASAWTARVPVFPATRFENRAGHPDAPLAAALLQRFGTKFVDLDGFLGLDSCATDLRRDLVNVGVDRLVRARAGLPLDVPLSAPVPRPRPTDPVLWRTLGCGGPTMRLHRDVRIAPSVDHAAALVRRDDIDEIPVLHGGFSAAPPSASEAVVTGLRVARHSANETEIEVDTTGAAWLLVKQPFHPYWRATVNGQEREIWQANLAFMAVPVSAGANRVQLRYDDAATAIASAWIAILCVAAVAALLLLPFGELAARLARRRAATSRVVRTA